MLIPPSEETYQYLDPHGNFTVEGKEKLLRDTDRYYVDGAETKAAIYTAVCVVKGRINEKIQERSRRAYVKLVEYCASDEFASVAGYDSELIVFPETIPVYMMECEDRKEHPVAGDKPFVYDCINYIDDFYNLYMKMLFYFRRLQLGLTGTDKAEVLKYIKDKRISVFLVARLLSVVPLGDKDKITVELADMYSRENNYSEALFLVSFMEKHCGDFDIAAISEKKAELRKRFS